MCSTPCRKRVLAEGARARRARRRAPSRRARAACPGRAAPRPSSPRTKPDSEQRAEPARRAASRAAPRSRASAARRSRCEHAHSSTLALVELAQVGGEEAQLHRPPQPVGAARRLVLRPSVVGDAVEHAVDERARLVGAERLRELDGLVEDDGARHVGPVERAPTSRGAGRCGRRAPSARCASASTPP